MGSRIIGTASGFILVLTLVAPTLGISYGQVDTATDGVDVGNVGALVGLNEDGVRVQICTGTQISPTVFLTAAHCILRDGERLWVSFDWIVPEPVESPPTTLYQGTAHPHPDYRCCANAGPFDMAVVVLDAPIGGITPAPLPTVGLLDRMSIKQLRSARFLTAGYGLARDTRKKAEQSLYYDGQRRWATQGFNSINRDWLTLSMNQTHGDGGTCFGDSGGPHFRGSTIVALTITGDAICKANDKTYRLDTPSSLAFIGQYVSLP